MSACVCLSNCLSGPFVGHQRVLGLYTQSVSVSHRRVFQFQASRGLGKVDVGKKSGIYLDYPYRLMWTHLIGSHSEQQKRELYSSFLHCKIPKQFMLLNSLAPSTTFPKCKSPKKKRFTINKLFYDQISMNIYQMIRSGFF